MRPLDKKAVDLVKSLFFGGKNYKEITTVLQSLGYTSPTEKDLDYTHVQQFMLRNGVSKRKILHDSNIRFKAEKGDKQESGELLPKGLEAP